MMAPQVHRGKSSLDVLQSMINMILIETGRALQAASKDSGKDGGAKTNTRFQLAIPSTIENFHQALDDIECDIIRAKSVLLRDLEELRAQRLALENPNSVLQEAEKEPAHTDTAEAIVEEPTAKEEVLSPQANIKEEAQKSISPEEQVPEAGESATTDAAVTNMEDSKTNQGPTPPSSHDAAPKTIGLGINTEGMTTESAPVTGEQQNSSIDSLFDIPDDNEAESDLNFDNMDFSPHDSTTNTQGQDQSQTQNHDFDLANFGTTSQDFNMTGAPTSTETSQLNTATTTDLLAMGTTEPTDTNMEMDGAMTGAEESVFDAMFFGRDDDVMGGGNEMEHGEFDALFFGIG